MTQQQQQGMKMSKAQEELLKAQTGYYGAKAENPYLGNQAKPPASIAEYNLYTEQTEASGGTPVPFDEWVKEMARLRASGSQEGKESVTTPAQGAVDTAYAQTYVDWTQGGQADALKGLNQLRAARESVRTKNVSGPGVGLTPPGLLPYLNPDAANTKELIEEVVQRNLRLILGAQFAEKEGERLIARAYNPALDEDINGPRLDRLIAQMEIALEEKQKQAEYYNRNGTLKGWSGKVYTIKDFEDAISGGSATSTAGSNVPEGVTQEQWDVMTPEQRALWE
jgi:hypothetical protein